MKKQVLISKTILTIGFIISIFLFNSCSKSKNEFSIDKVESVQNTKNPEVNVIPNQEITSPFEIKVDSKGIWIASEGELGIVTIVDENNIELGTNIAILTSVDGNWMTSGSALFKTTLIFEANEARSGKLIFHNNPGEGDGDEAGVSKSFEIPVKF